MPASNAEFLLAEIADAVREYLASGATRIIYLSQFPLSEEDAVTLQHRLGNGRVWIESRSGERTVWRETSIPSVWWGEYYNGPVVQLQTVEIAPVPDLLAAPVEDVQEGLQKFEDRLCTKPE